MRLRKGQRAPVFSVTDFVGQTVNLARYRGRYVLLSFYRYASCPFCNLRVHELSQRKSELDALGCEAVAVFQSPRERILRYVGRQRPPFPIIADPDLRLYRLYGIESSLRGFFSGFVFRLGEALRSMRQGFLPGHMEGNILRVPADFLIGPDGNIRIAYYGRDIGDHLPLDDLFNNLRMPCTMPRVSVPA